MLNACKTTKIYCRVNCPPGRRTKPENRVTFNSFEDAEISGYRACKVCNPLDDSYQGAWKPKSQRQIQKRVKV